MAGSYQKRNKTYPEPGGKMVKFYLQHTQYMDPSKTYVLPVNVNGYKRVLEFGKSHELPEEWVQVVEQARSAYIAKSSLREFERTGNARPQEEFADSGMRYEYAPDYRVIREREA